LLVAPVVSSESISEYTPGWVSVKGPKVYLPALLAAVCDVVVLLLGSVIVAVTPRFGVAPPPLSVNAVLAAVPVLGEIVATRLVVLTLSRILRESLPPLASATEQVTVYAPLCAGAVHEALDPVVLIVPPDAFHVYVNAPLPDAVQSKVSVLAEPTVYELAVRDWICNGITEANTAMEICSLADRPAESDNCAVKVKLCARVGVPLNTPFGARERPGGRLDADVDHVYGV
jgi:hypothetical protein